MKKKDFLSMEWPTVEQLEGELRREKSVRGRRRFFKALARIVILAAIAALLVAFVWMPVLHINGSSMAPGLTDGEIVTVYTGAEIEAGDVVAFYFGNKLLIKRVIAVGGDEVNVDLLGNVSVNGTRLDEPYVSNRAQGNCDVKMPYKVPSGYLFVMSDRRSDSLDSRSSAIGCVGQEQVLGRVVAQIWPLEEIKWIGEPVWDDLRATAEGWISALRR